MVDYIGWAKLGLATGVLASLIILGFGIIAGFTAGLLLGGPAGALAGVIIGGAGGIGFGFLVLIANTIRGGVEYVLGRAITEQIGWFAKSTYWRIYQCALLGRLTLSLLINFLLLPIYLVSDTTTVMSSFTGFLLIPITTLIYAILTLWGATLLKWKIPE